MIALLQFFALAAAIGWAGFHLCRYADKISDRTGLGRNWVGLVLLSTITSLPELSSGVSAVWITENADLAVGDVMGSCVFNLALVFLLDLMSRDGPVFSKAKKGHLLSGALGVILLSWVAFGILVGHQYLPFQIGHVGGYSMVIPLFYVLAMRTLFRFEAAETPTDSRPPKPAEDGRLLYSYFTLAALVVVACGVALPAVGKSIQEAMGWNESFVGTIFVAIATSVPEAAVTVGAVRLRAHDLAFSNLLGSNIFNMVILSVDDLFYRKGPLLRDASQAHAVTTISAILMTGLVLTALITSPKRRWLNSVTALSVLLLAVYLVNAWIVFRMGAGG
ncbi:MAG: sodium:calcium antiporter [Bdellovibrionales bacterium]|nr:sodium:calcium antiporter [Bdellovibrionales bacterium]